LTGRLPVIAQIRDIAFLVKVKPCKEADLECLSSLFLEIITLYPKLDSIFMKKSSNLSKWLLVILALSVTHLTYAEDLETMMLLDGWKELAKTRTQKAGKQIHDEALDEADAIMLDDPQAAARLLFKAAEYCRDLNDVKHAITLFELAIELSPDEPHYRRVYGDYLIGYRGLEEQAWAQLYKAKELAEIYPDKVDEEFTKTLNRSIHIFRRDTRDGVLTFERNQSDGALIYEGKNITITGGLDTVYGKLAKDPLDLSTDYFRARDFTNPEIQSLFNFDAFLESLLVENGGDVTDRDEEIDDPFPDGTPRTINTVQARNAARRAELRRQVANLERQLESSETLVSFLLRTPYANLPAVRLSYLNTYSFDGLTNLEDLYEPSDRVFDGLALELEKTLVLKNDLFLEYDIALFYQNVQIRNEEFVDDYYFLDLIAALNFRKEWGTSDGTVSLNVGGNYRRDLYDFEAYPTNQQRVTLRNLSFFADPFENNTNDRFRGRRSSGQEIGLIRDERREGSPDTKTQDWRFFLSNEELGLVDGKLDVYTTYTYRERNLLDANYGEGSYSVHQLSIEPLWVPIFDLYENDFIDGWEFVTVGLPLTYNIDDGPYDRAIGGITFQGQYVVSQAKLTLGFRIGVEYAQYTEVDEEDLGGFFRFSIF
jgi:hypothetical protein